MLCKLIAALSLAAPTITVMVDGHRVDFKTGQPVERKGRVLVPVRGVFEHLGAKVEYDEPAQLVKISKGDTEIQVTMGADQAIHNGNVVPMDTRAAVIRKTAYMPLRFFAEILEATVRWDGETSTVHIFQKQIIEPPEHRGSTTGGGG